jgi:hypothetical protein
MALPIDVIRLGLQRALRRIRQVFTAAMVLSTGHLRRECARLTHLCLTVRSLPGRRL